MCGRYTNTAGVQALHERCKVRITGEAGTRPYNIAPTQAALAVVSPHADPQARLRRWALIPTAAARAPGTGAPQRAARQPGAQQARRAARGPGAARRARLRAARAGCAPDAVLMDSLRR